MTVTKMSRQLDCASFFVRFSGSPRKGKNEGKKDSLDILDDTVQPHFPFSTTYRSYF